MEDFRSRSGLLGGKVICHWSRLVQLAERYRTVQLRVLASITTIYSFGLCIHTMQSEQLRRLRHHGLCTLATHTTSRVTVIAQLAGVWEAWTNPKKRQGFSKILPTPWRLMHCLC